MIRTAIKAEISSSTLAPYHEVIKGTWRWISVQCRWLHWFQVNGQDHALVSLILGRSFLYTAEWKLLNNPYWRRCKQNFLPMAGIQPWGLIHSCSTYWIHYPGPYSGILTYNKQRLFPSSSVCYLCPIHHCLTYAVRWCS